MKKQNDRVIKYAILIVFLVALGKILGFLKQSVIAWAFGANALTDVYFSADGFVSTIAQILSSSIAPTVLTQYLLVRNRYSEERANRFVRQCFSFFGALGLLLFLISLLLSGPISNIVGISYSVEQKRSLSMFIIGLSPIILLSTISGVAQGYLNANNNYTPGRLAGLFYSVFIIFSVFFLKDYLGTAALVVGFLSGYCLHSVFVLLFMKGKIPLKPSNPFSNEDFRMAMRKFVPLVIGIAVIDIGHLVDRIIASSLEEGSLSYLSFGQVISSDLVNALVVTVIGTVLLTSFTDRVAKNELTGFEASARKSIVVLLFLVILISVCYVIESEDLIIAFFFRGNFTETGVRNVNQIALYYVIGFLPMAVNEILVKIHYAYQDMKWPMIYNAVGIVMNVILSVALSRIMGVGGISLATSLSLLLVSVLLSISVKKRHAIHLVNKELWIELLKMIIAGLLSFGSALLLRMALGGLSSIPRLFIVGFTTAGVYFLACLVFRENVSLTVVKAVLNKLKRSQKAE